MAVGAVYQPDGEHYHSETECASQDGKKKGKRAELYVYVPDLLLERGYTACRSCYDGSYDGWRED